MFSRKDLIFSVATGFYTGLILWRILVFLKTPSFGLPTHAIWMVIVPILWIAGVNLGYFLGRWMVFFNQFGRYAAIGFTNAAVDFGILNSLIAYFDIATGSVYSVFKGFSFIIAVTHSYFWNKYWAFESRGNIETGELAKFLIVNIIAAAVNVGVASLVVNGIDPMFHLGDNAWANIGAIAGAAVALTFNFVGFRLIVFRADKPIS